MNFKPSEEQSEALEAWRGIIGREIKPITDDYRGTSMPRDVASGLLKKTIPYGVGAG